jgi:hypothetical protein
MKPSLPKLLALCGLLAISFSVLAPACARAQGTTASLEGTVVDQSDVTLPGVNVLAVHEPTGTRYGATTNGDGRYRILNMRVGGPYTVEASFVGFQTRRETGLRLQLDSERTLDFQLSTQTQQLEEVEVVAERNAVISPNRTGTSTNINQEQIDRLPTVSRSLSDFARLVPQATGSGGSSSLAGRNDRYNAIQIDGATLDDVFGLGDATPGSQAGAEPISLDAIQEFNVNIAPYDVRQSGFTGGQINAITKSGSNDFSGSLRIRRGTEGFTGDLDGIGTGEFSQTYYIATLGGPIIENKLFFFLSGEIKRENSPLGTRVGTNLDGTNVFDVDRNRLSDIATIADDVYDYDVGGIDPFDQREDDEKLLAKLDWNINDANRLTLRHNFVNARDDDGIGRGNNDFGFGNRQYVFRSTQNSTTAQLNSTLSQNAYNEARLVYTRIRDERDPQDALFPEVTFDLGEGNEAFIGIDRFSQANRLDQDLYEIADDFTYVTGDHTVTLGTESKIFDFANLFIQDFAGTYEFESFTFENDAGEEVFVSAEEAFRRGQPTRYQYSYATPAAGEEQPIAGFTAFQVGFYAQDEWQLNEDLRLTGGVRLDVPVLPEDPTFNPTAFEAFGRATSNVASGNLLWSPRVGFNYGRDFFAEDIMETQIRGGVGIFSGDPPFVWISNQYSNTGADLFRLDQSFTPGDEFVDENGNYDPNARFVPESSGGNPTDQPRPGDNPALSPIATTEINLISDDFSYPQTLRTNLAVDQELPLGFVATIEGLYSKTLNDVTFRNINIFQTDESRYGRPIYGGTVSNRFTNAILMENTNEGYEYSLTGQLQRRATSDAGLGGIGGSLSYTYNRAESVNNGTSSRAISNWQFNENLDVNNPALGTADFEVRHRFLGTLNYRIEWGEWVGFSSDRFATDLGFVFESRSGEPFSWIYDGNANSDTQNFNDLVYVPENRDDVILAEGSAGWELFDAFIESEDALDEARGSVIDRNTARAPWQNLLDLRVAQRIETLEGQDVEVSLDIENFLNMVNDDWGRIRRTSFNNVDAWDFDGYVAEGDVGSRIAGRIITGEDVGKPVISFSEGTVEDKLSDDLFNTSFFSRWRMRLGVRYTF